MKSDYYNTAVIRAMERLGYIEIRSKGTSMFPFIIEGDTCYFRSCSIDEVQSGDVLLFTNEKGSLICHRVLAVKKEQDEILLICKGDTNRFPDRPVSPHQVIGKLTNIRKKGFALSPDKGVGRIWGKLVMVLPPFAFILHRIAKLYRWRSSYLSTRP